MPDSSVHTIDLNFQGVQQSIAAYLIRHAGGAALVECGPASTVGELAAGLARFDLKPSDIKDVLVTHIHLDHAGAAGWLAEKGATVYVHERGAPHLIDPTRLLQSARRVFGDDLERLWGQPTPVPEEHVRPLTDGDEVRLGELRLQAWDTPGHARHHLVFVLNGLCFAGDVAGVRLPGAELLRLPTLPPEIDLDSWSASVERLAELLIGKIAPTHFGIYDDADWYVNQLRRELQEIDAFLAARMAELPDPAEFRGYYADWINDRSRAAGLSSALMASLELVTNSEQSADGLVRYWQKFRTAGSVGQV